MANLSNSEKAKHGRSAHVGMEEILKRCTDAGYLVQVSKNYGIGKEGYKNDKQFYAPFLIVFSDESKWVIFTTTSMRTDRIKGQQWDALNLKELDPLITHVYLVYPDGLGDKELSEFIRQNSKYVNKEEYSIIEQIVSQDEISNLIEQYAIKDKSSGQIKDIQGNSFESRVASILSFDQNLKKWKNNDDSLVGMHYEIYKNIVECFGLKKTTTLKVEATADKSIIGRLPSGGNPKTDVLVKVTDVSNTICNYTISCKRSSEQSVSVHQYDADVFAEVLDKDNKKLRILLETFQSSGNLRDFGEENTKQLTLELAPYVKKLSLWVLGGQYGAGTPDVQIADYILTYDNNLGSASIMRIEDYVEHLISSGISGHFGTPFSWTYPSKRKGKDIQLKCKIIK